MAHFDLLSHSAVRIVAAVVNFGIAVVALVYFRFGARDMRWSRSARKMVTRDPEPAAFWLRMSFLVVAALFTTTLGLALLLHQRLPRH